MAMMIFFTSTAVRILYVVVTRGWLGRAQTWRRR
jgi:hypothetical protein